MARGSGKTPGMLEEIESAGDRLAAWVDTHRYAVLGAGAAVLLLAAGYGGYSTWSSGNADLASNALAETRREFMRAMGAEPGALVTPEPANPEAATRIRRQYAEEFQRIAAEHIGTAPGALAAMEAGDLQEVLGDREAALETWSRALDDLGRSSALRALLLLRVAAAQEDLGSWAAAAEAYETAGRIKAYPLRYGALGEAARCLAQAGDSQRAIELFEEVESDAPPQVRLPDHVRQRLRELRAASQG